VRAVEGGGGAVPLEIFSITELGGRSVVATPGLLEDQIMTN